MLMVGKFQQIIKIFLIKSIENSVLNTIIYILFNPHLIYSYY